MAQLPLKLPLDQMQSRWKSQLDPVLASPLLQGHQVTAISLAVGVNYIEHGLGRPLMGWIVVDRDSPASVYSEQASNPTPSINLVLVASDVITVSLWVY